MGSTDKRGSKGEAKGASSGKRQDEEERAPKKGSYSAMVTFAEMKNRREGR